MTNGADRSRTKAALICMGITLPALSQTHTFRSVQTICASNRPRLPPFLACCAFILAAGLAQFF
jgi:hypothetical protein